MGAHKRAPFEVRKAAAIERQKAEQKRRDHEADLRDIERRKRRAGMTAHDIRAEDERAQVFGLLISLGMGRMPF